MSKELDEIRRKWDNRFGSDGDTVFQAVVREVDEKEFTCVVRRDGAVDYYDVRLRGTIDAGLKGLALIPALQSIVLVSRIGKSNELFVSKCTEIDKVVFTGNDLALTVDADNIDIKKGDKITIHADAGKLEITNDKVKVQQVGQALTITADSATVKVGADGITLGKGGSGLKKTLDDMLAAIQTITVTVPQGTSGTPMNAAKFKAIQSDLANYLK